MDKVCVLKECQKEIKKGELYRMVGMDIPYYNVFFHRECFNKLMREVKNTEGLYSYLAKNREVWFERTPPKKKRKKRKK